MQPRIDGWRWGGYTQGMKSLPLCLLMLALDTIWVSAAPREHKAYFKPFLWKSEPPSDCPFPASRAISGLLFTGVHSDYHFADTWYPTWAADGNLYSPFTDGDVFGEGSNSDGFTFANDRDRQTLNYSKRPATTGQAVLMGDDPLNLTIKSLGTVAADPYPYGGRYPCGSLVYKGVWYYGTYMKNFGEQSYFVNIPSKFISPDGRTAWLCYSANFAPDWNNEKIRSNPPGSHYGLVMQEIRLLGPGMPAKF